MTEPPSPATRSYHIKDYKEWIVIPIVEMIQRQGQLDRTEQLVLLDWLDTVITNIASWLLDCPCKILDPGASEQLLVVLRSNFRLFCLLDHSFPFLISNIWQ